MLASNKSGGSNPYIEFVDKQEQDFFEKRA